jgi:hypothetical protein
MVEAQEKWSSTLEGQRYAEATHTGDLSIKAAEMERMNGKTAELNGYLGRISESTERVASLLGNESEVR